MRKTLGLLVVLVLFLAGCSDDGTLKITDETAREIWFSINDGAEITLDVGESYSKSWDLSTSIFGSEEKDVDVAYEGYHVFYDDVEKTVEAPVATKEPIVEKDVEVKELAKQVKEYEAKIAEYEQKELDLAKVTELKEKGVIEDRLVKLEKQNKVLQVKEDPESEEKLMSNQLAELKENPTWDKAIKLAEKAGLF